MRVDGCRAKLRRARDHRDDLNRRIAPLQELNAHTVAAEPVGIGVFTLRCRNAQPMPIPDWATIIGDAVHNARAALDYLAWELAGGQLSDRVTMFPITDSERGWEASKGRVARIPTAARAAIKGVQPFTNYQPGAISILSVMRDLDDRDKHKLLAVTTAVQHTGAIRCRDIPVGWPLEYEINLFPNATLREGAELGSVTIATPYLGMRVEAEVTAAVVFGEDIGLGPRIAVVPALDLMIAAVTSIVDEFDERFFTPDKTLDR